MRTTGPLPGLRIVVVEPVPDPGSVEPHRSAGILARALRDAGHEVVYTGAHQTPEQIVETAIQEDADLVALPGADATLVRRIADHLAERDASDISVAAGAVTTAELLDRVAGLAAAAQH